MPDFDTDSQMMRRQQGLDAPETIESASKDHGDSDAKSAHDRRKALTGTSHFDGDQQDAILKQNGGEAKEASAVHATKGERPPLAAKDRSILGD